MKAEVGQRRERLESLLALAESNVPVAATSPPPRPKSWFARSGTKKPQAGEARRKRSMERRRGDSAMGGDHVAESARPSGGQRRIAKEPGERAAGPGRELCRNGRRRPRNLPGCLPPGTCRPARSGMANGNPWRPGRTIGPIKQAGPCGRKSRASDCGRPAGRRSSMPSVATSSEPCCRAGEGATGLEPELLKSCLERAAPRLAAGGGAAACG